MKKILKPFIKLIIILIVLINYNHNYVLALAEAGSGAVSSSDTTEEGETAPSYYKLIDPNDFEPDEDTLQEESGNGEIYLSIRAWFIVKAIRNVGVVVSVVILMIIGIKMMYASTEEKSLYKQELPKYIIGAILLFTTSLLPSIIYDIVSDWNI